MILFLVLDTHAAVAIRALALLLTAVTAWKTLQAVKDSEAGG